MDKRTLSGIVVTMLFFLLAASTIPVNATEEDLSHPDTGSDSVAGVQSDNEDIGDEDIPGYGIVAHRILLTANPVEIYANGVSTSVITAQLKDRRGRDVKVKDVIVEFETTRGTLSADSAVTDADGKATVTLTSGTKRGTAVVEADSDSVLTPGMTKVKFIEVAHEISLTVDPEKIPADGVSTSTIIAQLKDRKGNDVKVEDVVINFKTSKGTLSASSAVTDADGKAVVTLTSGTKRGTAVIKATSNVVLTPEITKVKFTKVEDEDDSDAEIPNFSGYFGDVINYGDDIFFVAGDVIINQLP